MQAKKVFNLIYRPFRYPYLISLEYKPTTLAMSRVASLLSMAEKMAKKSVNNMEINPSKFVQNYRIKL